MVIQYIRTGLVLFLLCFLLTGLAYPLMMVGIGKIFFPWKASGSLILQDGNIIGSQWIGQAFVSPGLFHGRPSATCEFPYNAACSSGSNLALTNPVFLQVLAQRVGLVRQLNGVSDKAVPVDLVTSSASGLDPDISPSAAYYQVPRIAKNRGLPEKTVMALVDQHIVPPLIGLIGEPRVNVLALNRALLSMNLGAIEHDQTTT